MLTETVLQSAMSSVIYIVILKDIKQHQAKRVSLFDSDVCVEEGDRNSCS